MRWLKAAAVCTLLAAASVIPWLGSNPVAAAQVAAQNDDQDEDGVPDSWEANGVEVTTPSGKRWLDLKGDGASPNGKDIYVWVDWMEAKDHSHKPEADAIQGVKDAFAKKNIKLHVFYPDKGIAETASLGTSDKDGNYQWDKFDKIRRVRFPKELEGKFHFCLFAHLLGGQGTTSGMSRDIGAYDFIVSLAGITRGSLVGTTQDQEGTFMHELGHNLGLRHGGGDDTTFKPNYLSVMNYTFQFDGLSKDNGQGLEQGLFDYSTFRLDDLDEAHLDRTLGMTANQSWASFGSFLFCACNAKAAPIDSVSGPIDWDCSLRPSSKPPTVVSTTVRRAYNNEDCALKKLPGSDADWGKIQFIPKPTTGIPTGMTLREADRGIALRIPVLPPAGVAASSIAQGVKIEWKATPLDLVLAYRVYRSQSGGAPVKVASTDKTFAVDATAVNGVQYDYFVRALLADRGANDPIFLAQDKAADFRKFVAPDRGKSFATMGLNEPPVDWQTPTVLLQTDPSKHVTIVAGR